MGVSKRIFEREIIIRKTKLNKIIKSFKKILPYDYDLETIEKYIKDFYYFDYLEFCDLKKYYDIKDNFLVKKGKKVRYNTPEFSFLLKNLQIVKILLRKDIKEKYKKSYCENEREKSYSQLKKVRELKLEKRKLKLSKAQERAQQVEPIFLDKLMGLYLRKNATQKDKMYILIELEKYYCEKTINFFRKVNDTEVNDQLREKAFLRLQNWGHYVRLRKGKYIVIHTKNKNKRKFIKEVYKKQISLIEETPKELKKQIEESLVQKIKNFDYFISHSSKNSELIQKIKQFFNFNKKNIYCDWISDDHYLKRTFISEATKLVIEKRMEQSKELVLVDTFEARNSLWVKYELNYFNALKKKMYVWDEKVKNIKPMLDLWYVDENYKKLKLY